jgi:hypothetical protein
MKLMFCIRSARRAFIDGLCFTSLLVVGGVSAEPAAQIPQWQPRLPPTAAKNLIPNSGFELGSFGWSSLGEVTAWGGEFSSLYGTVTDTEKFEGNQSLEIALGPGKTPVTYFDGWPAASVVQYAPLVVNLGWMTVQPGETYALSAYMKADRSGVPAKLVMRFGGEVLPNPAQANTNVEKEFTLTRDWARYTFVLTARDCSVCIGIGPDLRTQPDIATKVWIDAIQFERNGQASVYAPREMVETAIESGRFGNVFTADEPASVRFVAVSQSPSIVTLNVAVSLRDYFDAALPETRYSFNVPAGGRTTQSIPLKVPGPGFYRLTATTTSDGMKQETDFPLSVIYEYDQADAPFGVNHPPTTVGMLNQLRRAGILWGRNWSADWNQVEPRPNSFEWEQPDQHIARLKKAGWQILTLLPAFSSAKWASELPPDAVIPPNVWRGPAEWAWLSAAPKDSANLANYIRNVVERYKGRVNTWEFLNEPSTLTRCPRRSAECRDSGTTPRAM